MRTTFLAIILRPVDNSNSYALFIAIRVVKLMTRRGPRVAALFTIGTLLLLCLPMLVQAQGLNLSGASNCTVADFVAYADFVEGPGDTFTVVIKKRNVSGHPCVFDGPVYGPSLVPDRIDGEQPVELCEDCENHRLPIAQRRVKPPITVNPGDVARQTLRWKTKPPNVSVKCLQLDWMAQDAVVLVVPSLLKPVCSEVDYSRFTLASPEEGMMPDVVQAPALKLTSNKPEYYQGESFSVRVARPHGEHSISESCPKLYQWHRSPDGSTRLDEVRPQAFKGCKEKAFGHEAGNWESGFEVDSGANSRWAGVGKHAMQVFQLVDSSDDPRLPFVASNVLQYEILDPTTVVRKWGQRAKGTAADITLDRDTYRVGEDIPIHIAVEDFDANLPLYAWDPLWDPCMAIGIEVEDAAGHPVPPEQRMPNWSFCMGHGFGPRPVAKGKVIPIERSLGGAGWLPNRPGTYTLIVKWATCSGPKLKGDNTPQELATKMRPYAVAHATATIHIVEK